MVRSLSGNIQFAPLLILHFSLLMPTTFVEAEKFNLSYPDPSCITSTADKLRWYRYKKALFQREVADYAGMDRATYGSYEEADREYYPIEKMNRIAKLLEVPVTELLDEYNLFLYHNQGMQIKAKRKSLHMTQKEYAKYLGVLLEMFKKWEQNRVRISKSRWERYFKESDKKTPS